MESNHNPLISTSCTSYVRAQMSYSNLMHNTLQLFLQKIQAVESNQNPLICNQLHFLCASSDN